MTFMDGKMTARRGRPLMGIAAVVLAASLQVTGTRADVLVYEPFAYDVDANVVGQDGGEGFVTSWGWIGGLDTSSIRSDSLAFGALEAEGRSMETSVDFLNRSLNPIAGTAGSTTWVSFLFCLDVSSTLPNSMASMAFSGIDTFDSAVWMGAFTNVHNEFVLGLGLSYDTPVDLSSIVISPGQVYLLCASIDWGVDADPATVRLYVNPAPGSAPSTSSAVAVASLHIVDGGGNSRISDIGVVAFLEEGQAIFDEVRIATSFAEITPVPEPSSVLLFSISCVGLFAGLRRRFYS
jgi:hypothetical protein